MKLSKNGSAKTNLRPLIALNLLDIKKSTVKLQLESYYCLQIDPIERTFLNPTDFTEIKKLAAIPHGHAHEKRNQ